MRRVKNDGLLKDQLRETREVGKTKIIIFIEDELDHQAFIIVF